VVARVQVSLTAVGFVDSPLSAALSATPNTTDTKVSIDTFV
jgi:hypothetical protein